MNKTRIKAGYLWILSASIATLLAAEMTARFAVPRISGIEGRVAQEKQVARTLSSKDGARHVLLVGNSLLDASVQVGALDKGMPDGWRLNRFVIEDAYYLDWYYGLKGLLEGGSRPDVIALMIAPKQFVVSGLRGTYSSYHLFRSADDTLHAGRRAGYNLTELSELMIGHYAAVYGLRSEIRDVVMNKTVPNAEAVAQMFRGPRGPAFQWARPEVRQAAHDNFAEFSGLCQRYQVRCVVIPAAELHPGLAYAELSSFGQAQGLHSSEFAFAQSYEDRDFQTDRFHMSARGAGLYTQRLALAFRQFLQ
jgi:hypothetical protein